MGAGCCTHTIDNNLHRIDGTSVTHDEGLADKEIVLFYFSAHWCPPCKIFTPILKNFYDEVKDSGVEIIFVSWDNSEEEMENYMRESHGNWFFYKYDKIMTRVMNRKYNVGSIPSLVVVRKSDSYVITQQGREAVQSRGAQAINYWK